MDVFDAPVVLLFGFDGPAQVDTSTNPAAVLEIGGIVLYYA